jgi:tetratricopeptide (TPR) repeat protein
MQVRTAKELGEEGLAAYQQKDFRAAAQAYQASALAYRVAGDALMAAEMANNCSVAWLQAAQPQEALTAVEGTELIFAAAGDLKRQAVSIGNQAAALEALQRLDEAIASYTRSAELLKQAGEGELRAYVLQSISKIQFRTGRQLEALASMQAGIEGINHPNLRQRLLKRLLRLPMRWLGSR